MSIFGRPKKDLTIAIFDITSSSVGGVLFQHYSDKLPEVLTASRFPTDFFSDLNFQKIQRSLHKTFERTINALKRRMPKEWRKPDLVIVVFSSPYYISQTKIVRLTKAKTFEITKHLIDGIIGDEISSFRKRWQKNEQKDEHSVEIVEHEVLKINLNGYPVKQPIGKRAQSMELSIYLSLGIKIIQDKLKECIYHSFGETPVRFQTFPFVAFSGLKNIVDVAKGLLLIDVGGEITDLSLIKDGILEETASFPWGENFLVRRIASAFHFSLEESFSLLAQYARGDLHAETKEKVRKVIEEASIKWCDFFKEAVKEFPESPYLQNFLFIGGKGASALKDFAPCAAKPVSSQFLLPEAFKNHFDFRKGFSEDKDILLMISALFADKLFLEK